MLSLYVMYVISLCHVCDLFMFCMSSLYVLYIISLCYVCHLCYKRVAYFEWLKFNKIDIACVPKTFITQNKDKFVAADCDGHMINCTTESNHSCGTSALLRNNLDIEIINENNSDDGSVTLLNFKYNQYIYTICSINAPNKIQDKLLFL